MPNYKDFDLDLRNNTVKGNNSKNENIQGKKKTNGCYTYGNRSCPNTMCAY